MMAVEEQEEAHLSTFMEYAGTLVDIVNREEAIYAAAVQAADAAEEARRAAAASVAAGSKKKAASETETAAGGSGRAHRDDGGGGGGGDGGEVALEPELVGWLAGIGLSRVMPAMLDMGLTMARPERPAALQSEGRAGEGRPRARS